MDTAYPEHADVPSSLLAPAELPVAALSHAHPEPPPLSHPPLRQQATTAVPQTGAKAPHDLAWEICITQKLLARVSEVSSQGRLLQQKYTQTAYKLENRRYECLVQAEADSYCQLNTQFDDQHMHLITATKAEADQLQMQLTQEPLPALLAQAVPPEGVASAAHAHEERKTGVQFLKEWTSKHWGNLNPSSECKKVLAELSGLTQSQVKKWFCKQRRIARESAEAATSSAPNEKPQHNLSGNHPEPQQMHNPSSSAGPALSEGASFQNPIQAQSHEWSQPLQQPEQHSFMNAYQPSYGIHGSNPGYSYEHDYNEYN